MSSRLPESVVKEFDAAHRDRKGRYRCVGRCGKRYQRSGIHIDHIKPEVDFPELRHDVRNLQPLCIPEHRAKTAKEATARARMRKEGVGWAPWRWVAVAVLLYAAVVMLRYGYLEIMMRHDEAASLVTSAGWGLLGAVAVAAGLRGVRWWTRAGQAPQERSGPSDALVRVEREARLYFKDTEHDLVKVSGSPPDRFTVRYGGTGFPDRDDAKRADFVAHMSAKLGARLRGEWRTDKDEVTLVRRPDLPESVPHPGFDRRRPWNIVPLGLATTVDFLKTAHVLVIGATGSGKTVLLRAFVEAFIDSGRRHGAKVRLGDPKMIELLGFEEIDGIETVAATDEELFDLALDADAEMRRRFRLFREERVPMESHDVILLLIDEYEEFVKRMEAYWPSIPKEGHKHSEHAKKPGMKNPATAAMSSILAMARRAHIHVVIGTQRPDAAWFGGGARDNMQGRIGVGPLKLDAARMAFDSSEYGRDVPIDAKGRITVQMLDGEVVEDQAYWVPDRTEPAKWTDADREIMHRLDRAAELRP